MYRAGLYTDAGELWSSSLAFTVVSLGNFDKKVDQLDSPAEDWMYLLEHLPTMTETPPAR